jgi:glucose/arabinose dehydrogenase
MRASRSLVALVVVGAVALAACSGDDDDTSSNTRPPTSDAATTSTSATGGSTTTTAEATPDLAAVKIKLTEVARGLQNPVAFAVRKGYDGFYIAEQHVGRIVHVVDGQVESTPTLDLGSNEVSQGNEQGLLGITFTPDGATLYIDYTDAKGDTHVQELPMNGKVADASKRRDVLTVAQPYANHNGGQVIFGPDDMLYIGLGDGGLAADPQGRAQNKAELLGKLLRINPKPSGGAPYSVPSNNPFVNDKSARPEIWMWGLRNPWRFTFDRSTGDLWIADVGQGTWEEIDYSPAGKGGTNWGWDRREGAHPFEGTAPADAVDPLFEVNHSEGYCAIIGGYVYRGSKIPALRGAYVWSDSCKSEVQALTQSGGKLGENRALGAETSSIVSFGEDADGELYALSLLGTVYRIDPA